MPLMLKFQQVEKAIDNFSRMDIIDVLSFFHLNDSNFLQYRKLYGEAAPEAVPTAVKFPILLKIALKSSPKAIFLSNRWGQPNRDVD